MARMRWGRLHIDVKSPLRRGAWYRVAKVTSLAAVVEVNRLPVPVPQYLIEIVSYPPRRWTVVPRPRDARLPADWGPAYGVCPSCRGRSALRGRPHRLACRRCRGEFEVAWDEAYLSNG